MSPALRRVWLAVTLASLGVACSDRAPTGPARRVILITCDTLRADRLGCYGYARPTSPHVDTFAAESTLYVEAWSSAPLTGPALSSLLSGRHPDEIGASPTNRELMPPEVLTLAEVAREAGIATAAFVSNGVLRRAPASQGDVGVQQGFDVFDDSMNSQELNRALPERTADACTDAVLAWLADRSREEPFFLWVHYQDPHGPYTPPTEHAARFARDPAGEEPLPAGVNHSGKGQIPRYQIVGDERRPGPYEDRYDGEIAFFDAELGRLLDALRARGLYDDSLIVFTADHGEALGEHDHWFCHGENLHREMVRVPLIVRTPRAPTGAVQSAAPRRETRLVTHLDVWPTVIEALGLPAIENRGASLLREPPEGRVALQFLGPLTNPGRRLAVTDGRWRVILVANEPARLYDLAADPGETRNLASEHRDVLLDLDARFRTTMSSDPRPWSRPVLRELDKEGRRGLDQLGYTAGDDDGH